MRYGPEVWYFILIIASLVLGGGAQAYIKSTYKKWSRVPSSSNRTGAEMARSMLEHEDAIGVGIGHVTGHLTDNFDPRSNMLHLSDENFQGGSVASIAVACHEAGHAVQHARRYGPAMLRSSLAPMVSFTQTTWPLLIIASIVLKVTGLIYAAVVLFGFTVIFQLVTLPVEIDASRRAVAFLGEYGSGVDQEGAKAVLRAAALTYVAAALISILQLIYYLSIANRRR